VHGRCVVVVTNATSKTLNVHTEKFSDGIYFVAVRNGNKQDVIKTLKVSR
jgi:hypothetical protein